MQQFSFIDLFIDLSSRKTVKDKFVWATKLATNKMQQFSFIDLFIDLFESAVHVPGDKLVRLQEHFWLCIQLLYNAPVLLPTGDMVTWGNSNVFLVIRITWNQFYGK